MKTTATAKGTYCCPICMKATPHTHTVDKWIGVDFDGTIAFNVLDRTDPYQLGEPIPEMINRVRDWIGKGYTVKLLTARMNQKSSTGKIRDIEKMREILKAWCRKHIGIALECTNAKDGWMEVLWDDRAVHVIPNTGLPLFPPEVAELKSRIAELEAQVTSQHTTAADQPKKN